MIRKLTIKAWVSIGIASILCLGIAGFFGAVALKSLKKDSINDFYLGAGIGLIFVIWDLVLIIKELKKSVRRRVKQYLKEHPGVTMEQLDEDFAAAQHVTYNLSIGKRWSFSHCLDDVLVENDRIAWVYSGNFESKHSNSYYLYLGFADGREENVSVPGGLNALLMNKASILKEISKIKDVYVKFPHIVVGNNPEYKYMFKNDREAFLNLRYRQHIGKPD